MYWPPEPDLHKTHVDNLANGASAESGRIRVDDDPRVTSVGAFLRKWSLDELPNLPQRPQRRDVGCRPRPLVPYEVEALDSRALQRLKVKPGVTGLAQVNGRLDLSLHKRTDYDLAYVRESNLVTDLLIIFRTPFAIFRRSEIQAC